MYRLIQRNLNLSNLIKRHLHKYLNQELTLSFLTNLSTSQKSISAKVNEESRNPTENPKDKNL